MCQDCDDLQQKIAKLQQLLVWPPIDSFTTEQLRIGVSKLEARKAQLHPTSK
jgi:hypothetical protein